VLFFDHDDCTAMRMKRKCLNSDEDSSIGDAIGDVNGGRAMDSPILNLLDLGEGPLNDILEFGKSL